MGPHNFSPSIQKIFQKLIASSSPLEQIQAAYKLAHVRNKEEALDALIRGLVLPDPEVKLTILDIFLQPEFQNERIIGPVMALLKDENVEVKLQAVEILGSMKVNSAVDLLVNALSDSDADIRYAIMAALANIGVQKTANDLGVYIDSDSWEDRYHAVDAIGMLANPVSVPYILKALQDPHPKVRENAALSVGHYKTQQIIDQLIILLDDEVRDVQGAAAYMLGEFKNKEAVPHLLDFLKSDCEDLILIALEALGKIKDTKALSGIITMLDHPAKEISLAAQETLDVFPNMVLLEPLIQALKADVIIRYIEHRLNKFPQTKSPSHEHQSTNTKRMLADLNLPLWVEMLLYEVLIEKDEKKAN